MSGRPRPGRSCPLAYRYGAAAFRGAATLQVDTLWIAGGLYGNVFALERLLELHAAERGAKALVFNGDFHWFDADAQDFAAIERGVAAHVATRGNVETELARPAAGAGCGCAYPEWVGDDTVERSNRIIERLCATALRVPRARARLAALPMIVVAEVGGTRVGIVHGDAGSLAGWGFSQEALATPEGLRAAAQAFDATDIALFASSHSCLPVLQAFAGGRAIVNNGSAGMPNFLGTRFGVATRISRAPSAAPLYGMRLGALHVEAVAIDYDADAWTQRFLAQWPAGSDAHASYFSRITSGPSYRLERALRPAAEQVRIAA
ncbi:MAG: hypothetical protein R3357_13960 [Burkholderiales bacterium]|nr:hypothetical protein [Burkholderiales bacterium]